MTHADALREAAAEMEHGAEYNVNETLGWTAEERAENNRLIWQARDLRARADAADRPVLLSDILRDLAAESAGLLPGDTLCRVRDGNVPCGRKQGHGGLHTSNGYFWDATGRVMPRVDE